MSVLVGCATDPPTPYDAGVRDMQSADSAVADMDTPIGDAQVIDAGPEFPYCPTQHRETSASGLTITICEVAFATPPYVHLPADGTVDGVMHVIGGVARSATSEDMVFRTRDAEYATGGWLSAQATEGNLKYAYYLYDGVLSGDTVESVTPLVRIDDHVFTRLLASRVFEGVISPRIVTDGVVTYDYEARDIPIRVRFEPEPTETSSNPSVTGFERFPIEAQIENATRSRMASDGTCFPSLAAEGERNPLTGAAAGADTVKILRHPSMHGIFDDVFTWDWPAGLETGNNMGGGLFISTADLIQATAPNIVDASTMPHGTPWSGPSTNLTQVTGGGGACP